MGAVLEFCARHGRWGLVIGLVCGLLLPGLAQILRPWLPEMVAGLLAITAFRVGYRASVGQVRAAPRVLAEVLVLQLAMPFAAIAVAWALGAVGQIAALAIILMLAAPSISGSANFAALLGRDPAPAMQVLVLGTALFPITAFPVFMVLSGYWDALDFGLNDSLRVIAVILGAAGLGFALRAVLLPDPTERQVVQLDGLGVIALGVIVIGLMAGIGPLIGSRPQDLVGWLALVFLSNFGLQAVSFFMLSRQGETARTVPLSLIAGNRNVALFLLALPREITDPLLPFIGSYQLPMYLTPLAFPILLRFVKA